MTDELDALLAAVHDNPRDVLPRLVYADWLDDHGEHKYAELIRLGVRLGEQEPTDPRVRKAERERRYRLSRELFQHWNVSEMMPVTWTDNRTVLTDFAPMTADQLIEGSSSWPAYFRPRRIALMTYRERTEQVLASLHLTPVCELWFHDSPTARFIDAPWNADDRVLDLMANFQGMRLRKLHFVDSRLSLAALERFARSPLVERLNLFSFELPSRLYQYEDVWHGSLIEIHQPGRGLMLERLSDVVAEYPEFAS